MMLASAFFRLHRSCMAVLALATVLMLAGCQPAVPPSLPAGPAADTPAAAATAPGAATVPASGGEMAPVAFVRDHTLYIQTTPPSGDLIPVESCAEPDCRILYPKWSPDGEHLLYYVGSFDGSVPQQLRIADLTGNTQTVADNAAYVRPGAWSPAGDAVAYLTDTGRYAEDREGPAQRIQELWVAPVDGDGTLGVPERQGEVPLGEGCGGGGRSQSALAYEEEGGFAYGYLAGVFAWTPSQILLYSENCTNLGVARFDLAADQPLTPYPVPLRSLSLNAAGDAWVAVDDQGQMVTGTPESLEFTVVPTAATPELVFYGPVSGNLYYTTLEITGGEELMDEAAALDESVLLQPYFDFTSASIREVDAATGADTELYSGDAYAYARVTEQDDGAVLFSRVENSQELLTALREGEIRAGNWRVYLPTVDVLRLASPEAEPALWLPDAAQFSLAQPQAVTLESRE